MFRLAYKCGDKEIVYYDLSGNKYIASGGNLAWRVNNPGLVHSHSHFSRKFGSIGSCGPYSIFSTPLQGRQALSAWLHSRKYFDAPLKTVAEHYHPNNPEMFLQKLTSFAMLPSDVKLKEFSNQEFARLLVGIEKLCGYAKVGDESFSFLPKIIAKIENGKNLDDTYLVGDHTILSKDEAIEWILSYRLDAVIVHKRNGGVYLRSRPNHCIWNIKMHEASLPPSQGGIDSLVRIVGEKKSNQNIWGFINGVSNTKESALKSAEYISNLANGNAVYSMPNDTAFGGIKDLMVCGALKITIETPIVKWAARFFRYLLDLSKQNPIKSPVIVFVHSQGAIITEHALELLDNSERKEIRIFTFGGGSFIAPGKCHLDSHNYASAADPICRMGSPNLQLLALERYYAFKKGMDLEQLIRELSFRDAIFDLDTTNAEVIEVYMQKRTRYYEREFVKISNVTVLDPDPGYIWEHRINSDCYQTVIGDIVRRYQ